ncbi:hypothetical protein [Pendulispora albinea]|uniref:Uncharacterized protein n=1 Tax=Pendulispora albinea TaxID=2741071 RepID=A0ABZ2LVY3_9BACT
MDTIDIPTRLSKSPTLRVSAESELMKNYQGALPTSPERDLFAVHDAQLRPIVFGFGTDGRLFAIHHRDEDATGWTQVDLTPSLADLGVPVTIAAGQLPGGNIFVAVGMKDKSDPTKTRVAIAGPLSPDLSKTDWSNLRGAWLYLPLVAGASTPEKIAVGPIDDGQGFGIPTIAVSVKGTDPASPTTFLARASVDSNTGAMGWGWIDFPTPTVKATLRDFALGAISDLGPGVYMLYDGVGEPDSGTAEGTWLVFKTFPDARGRGFDRQLLAPSGARCLATSPGRDGTTALFVAGASGVHWFPPDQQSKRANATPIAGADLVPEILPGGLIVRGDQAREGITSVWVLSGENLYRFDDLDGTWTTPLLLRRGVARVAPLSNDRRYANELLYVGTDVEETRYLQYMWQDPSTTLWKSDDIPLAQPDRLYEFGCYTTHLSFEDANGQPLLGRAFRVSAGSRVRAVINGVAHLLDPATEIEAATDFQGHITIIQPVRDLATPQLHLRADFFDGIIDVNPAHNVADRLHKVSAPSDVPVLPAKLPDPIQASDVVSAVRSLASLHPASAGDHAAAVSYRTSAAPQALRTAHLPEGGGFSLSFDGGGYRVHDAASLQANFSLGGWFSHAVGDAIAFFESSIHEVKHFVVKVEKEVVTFAAYLGETAVQFVVKTAEEVYKLVSWVFQKIEVAFDDLIHWLGYLFEWKDIWHTHKELAAMTRAGLDYIGARADAEIAHWEKRVDDFFDHLGSAVRSAKVPADMASKRLTEGAGGPVSTVARALKSPAGNWAFYQFQHGGLAGGREPHVDPVDPSGHESLLREIRDGFVSAARDLQGAMLQFIGAWHAGDVTLSDLGRLAEAPLLAALEPLRPVMKRAFDLLRAALRALRAGLDAEFPVPFIGALYEWLTTFIGDKEKLTFINGIALLVAIPLTIVSKALGRGVPFSGGPGFDRPESFASLLEPEARGRAARLTTAANDDRDSWSAAKFYIQWGGMAAAIVGLLTPVLRAISLYQALTASSDADSPEEYPLLTQGVSTYGTDTGDDGGASPSRLPAGLSRMGGLERFLLIVAAVCDAIQFVTTLPIPQKELPVDSLSYWFRWGAIVAHLLPMLAGYYSQIWKTDEAPETGGAYTFAGDFAALGFVLGGNTISVIDHMPPSASQWAADLLSTGGGTCQGLGEILASAASKDDGPASKLALSFFAVLIGGGGLFAAWSGTSIYIYLASKADGADGTVFTVPGG